ncbi:hypothetical protein GQ53DRAFT_805688 [Thozetella sp. PMI_491]|nr:hypothetical protein GQ53DRAFT_805688 [Thozetella sp. PMI_491]
MAENDDRPTCVSPDPHDEGAEYSIRDYLSHFLGCVEFRDRLDLFKIDGRLWTEELKRERRKVQQKKPLEELEIKVTEKMHREVESCIDELFRIDLLRATLLKSPDQRDRDLVTKLEESRDAWRSSTEYRTNLPLVQAWSRRGNTQSPTCKQLRDVSLSLCDVAHHPPRTLTERVEAAEAQPYNPENDIKAYAIRWEYKGHRLVPNNDTSIKARFPDQRHPLNTVLQDSPSQGFDSDEEPTDPPSPTSMYRALNPLRADKSGKMLRYFHFPANNMMRAIASYYDELTTNFQISHPNKSGQAPRSHMVLRPQYWRGQQHGNLGAKVHMRHLRPLCKAVPSNPNEEDNPQNITLFMPYLHWETNPKASRVLSPHPLGQYLLDAARLYESMGNYRDKELMSKYLHADPPLHPRRTLDQAYYGSLENTEYRDGDQVVYRATRATAGSFHQYNPETKEWKEHKDRDLQDGCDHCRRNIRKVAKLVMVDQLWMWILDANTVLTFFPRRYGTNKHDISGVHKSIRTRLKAAPENRIRSAFDLGLLIIEECSGTFFDRTRNPDPKQPPVIDLFAEAIADVTSRHTDASLLLWRWMEHVKSWYQGNIKPSVNVLLDINAEGKLQSEIKDIIEEIDIMLSIIRSQKEVLKSYISQVEEILNPNGEFGSRATTWTVDEETQVTEFQSDSPSAATRRPLKAETTFPPRNELPSHIKNKVVFRSFMKNASELAAKLSSHVEELDRLRTSAQTTAESIKDILALKQQQASALQSWQSSRDAEVTVNQGRSVMVFTVITIIFAPLSLMCAIFSMQNELSSTWTFDFQIKLIFAISSGIAFVAILLAFNRWVRGLFPFNSIIFSPIIYVSTFLLVNVPWPGYSIYVFWLRLNELSRDLTQAIDIAAESMRARVIYNEIWRKKEREEMVKYMRDRKMEREESHTKHGHTRPEGQSTGSRWFRGSRARNTGDASRYGNGHANGRSNGHTNGRSNGHTNRPAARHPDREIGEMDGYQKFSQAQR